MALHVELVAPDREIWSGSAQMVVAKTLDGDIGILGSHPPVLGILAPGSVVRIRNPETAGQDDAGPQGDEIAVAVSAGFLSVADDRVSILVRSAELGGDVDVSAARAELEAAGPEGSAGEEDKAAASYARARLRAAGQQV